MTTTNDTEKKLPVLPIRDQVVFPGMAVPLFIGREKSAKAIEEAMEKHNNQLVLVTQKDATNDEPAPEDLYETGTVATILQAIKLPDGTLKVMVEAQSRAKLSNTAQGDSITTDAQTFHLSPSDESDDFETLVNIAKADFESYAMASTPAAGEIMNFLSTITDPAMLADAMASHITLPVEQKQALLEAGTLEEVFESVVAAIEDAKSLKEVEDNIKKRVNEKAEQTQKDFFLQKQLEAIREEMGDDSGSQIDELGERIKEKKFPENIRAKVEKEYKKLKAIPPQSPESTGLINYIDALLDYPFGDYSNVDFDLEKAKETLDSDHYGLEKVKEQVLENLAVQARMSERGLTDEAESDIMCLVGPPGVGKTSICKSLAKATGREYVRMAVGGVTDEAQIRGHRRTYIGSKPGKIYEKMKEAGTENPLFVIDEIDKLSSDSQRGDPSAAMLEVLDPEQNDTFEDNYLEVPLDLSKVKFVCTANVWGNIPGPLQDRMETIFLGSYTEDEKLEIAKQHLVRKQRKAHGLDENEFKVSDDALRDLIRYYTKESGVRNLQREIKKLCRKAVVDLANGATQVEITADNLADDNFAGKRKIKYDMVEDQHEIGVVTGLAYTSVGGETLPIEAVKWPEANGKFIYTGSLGDVMKESIQVAEGWLKAKAGAGELSGVTIEDVLKTTFRVHVPEGATPKDGPSAGAAMLTAIFSVATRKPVRKDVAMTGELSLRGKVTAIGGLREKLSAAARGGYKTVLIPQDNEKDLDEVPQQVKDALTIHPVSTIEEVLKFALVDGNDLFKPANDVPAAPEDQGAEQIMPRPSGM